MDRGPAGGYFGSYGPEGEGTYGGWIGGGSVQGGFVYQGLAPLANMPGIDNDVPAFYDGSQNGAGNAEPLLVEYPSDHRLHIYEYLLDKAKKEYPKLADKPDQFHHIGPLQLGYPRKGPTVPLNPAYHQWITNLFRAARPFRGQGPPSDSEAWQILIDVYTVAPLFLP